MKRFWDKVNKNSADECWEWTAKINRGGYGQFKLNGRTVSAHRFSYYLEYGDFDKDLFVLHKCDNRKCVNPNHLFVGTNKDNMMDMSLKNRGSNGNQEGENNNRSKLKYKDVVKIKNMISSGSSNTEIASIFNVHHATISKIKRGKSWK